MQAIVMETFGDPDVLHPAKVLTPEPRPADLLVRVHAAGVNRADLTQRRGGYGWADFGDSGLMGLEVAGEVVAAGAQTSGFRPGDRVMGIVGGGGYAEMARMDYRMAMPVPAGLDYVHAAAIPEVFVTAHEALFHLAGLRAGDRVLIHAASGGVGSAAVQLAAAAGVHVIATAGGDKLDRVRDLGAEVCVDYRRADFAAAVTEWTSGAGVDAVIDFIGAPYFARNLAALADGGRLIQVGLIGGHAGVDLPLETLLYRHLRIIGTVMKSRPAAEKHAMTQRFAARWLGYFDGKRLTPVIDSVFPLARAAAAHRRMEAGDMFGKIILTTAIEAGGSAR